MSQPETVHATHADVPSLIARLGNRDIKVRERARRDLVHRGEPVVAPLIEALAHPNGNVRWEAAKALGELRDPAAAPALVETLEDRRFDVRWLAAEALIALGSAGVPALLRGLQSAPWDAQWLRQGAHHVLRVLAAQDDLYYLHDPLAQVVAALEGAEPAVGVPGAAHNALIAVRQMQR
jgi:HEAT repeat protein